MSLPLLALWYGTYMKAIQVTFDEALLERLDHLPEVRERGRSAVLREAATAYLARKRTDDIARRYREGYGDAFPPIEDELAGWTSQGAWPEA